MQTIDQLLENLRGSPKLYVLVIFGFVISGILGILTNGSIYSPQNLTSLGYKIPEFGLLAIGMSLAFLTGGIDLSLIANANTSGIFAALILTGGVLSGLNTGSTVLIAILVALGSAMLFGFINGLVVGKLSAHPMIVTLANMLFISGIGMAITDGESIVGFPETFTTIGTAKIFGIPVIFIFFLIVAIIFGTVLSSTGFGRKLYLYGENKNVALFSGIDNDRIGILIYTITGFFAGLAGLIIISRVNSAKVGYGDAYLLKTLLVCMIGGINPEGGKGKLSGVLLTILIIYLLTSAFNFWQLSPYNKKLIWGSMLLVIMFINYGYQKYKEHRLFEETISE